MIKNLNRGKQIIFAGYTSNIQSILPAIDCLVVPSMYDDPMPTVMMEASLFRKPIAAFNRGGIGEFVVHGKNGFLAEKGNIKQLASAMYAIARNPKAAAKMGKYSYRRAVNKYGLKRYMYNINTILAELENGNYRGDPCRSGKIVKGSEPAIYYIGKKGKRHILNEKALYNNGLDWSDIITVEDSALQSIPEGKPII